MSQHSVKSTSTETEVEPESSSIGKYKKKSSANSIKQTIEETEKEAMKMYTDSLQSKAKNEENKRKKLLVQANHIATADIEAKDKIAQASQMAAMAQKTKVEKFEKELNDEAEKWVQKNKDLAAQKQQA